LLDTDLKQRHHGRVSPKTRHKVLLRLGWLTAVANRLIGIVVGLRPDHWREAGVADQVPGRSSSRVAVCS